MIDLETVGAFTAGVVTLAGAYATLKRLKPQEKVDISQAASAVATAATTLLDPMERRIRDLEARITDQEGVIGGLKARVEILQTENYHLRTELEQLRGQVS